MRAMRRMSVARRADRRRRALAAVLLLFATASTGEGQWITAFGEWADPPGSNVLARAKGIIESGTNINARHEEGSTFLHGICYWGYPDACELLLKNGADPNIVAGNGMNALHWAVVFNACEMMSIETGRLARLKRGKEEVCGILIKRGIDLEVRDIEGNTALHWAIRGNALRCLPNGINGTVCDLLIQANANVNATNSSGQTPLHLATEVGDAAGVLCDRLVAKGAKVDMTDEEGLTPLFCAVSQGNTNLCKALIAHGADANVTNATGETLLHMLGVHGDTGKELAETFISKGVRVDARDAAGYTPLHSAVTRKDKELCRALIGHGADVNAKTRSGLLPLHLAVVAGDKEIVELLLSKGVDINAKTESGQTALDRAKAAKLDDMEDFLIEKGAQIRPMIERVK